MDEELQGILKENQEAVDRQEAERRQDFSDDNDIKEGLRENIEEKWTFDDLTINIAVYWGADKVPLQAEVNSFDQAEANLSAMRHFIEKYEKDRKIN